MQIWRKNIFIILPSKRKLLNILGLLCRIEIIKGFIILPSKKKNSWIYWVFFEELKKYIIPLSKKLLEYLGSSLQNWKKWLYYSSKQKNSLNILGLLCRIEKKCAKNHLKETSLNILGLFLAESRGHRMLKDHLKKSLYFLKWKKWWTKLATDFALKYPKPEGFFAMPEWNKPYYGLRAMIFMTI